MVDKVVWEGDGTTFTIKSDNVDVLQTPLVTLTTPLATLVGKDPATGLPAFCPPPLIPPPQTIIVSTPVTVVPGSPTNGCTQVKCGAANALVLNLDDMYGKFQGWVNAALKLLVGGLVGLVGIAVSAFLDGLTGGLGLVLAPEEIAMITFVAAQLTSITADNLANGLPDISNLNLARLNTMCWCALSCTGNQVLLDKAQLQAWQSAVAASPSGWYFGLEQDFLAAILLYAADVDPADWAAVAAMGANNPNTTCDAYVCP